ncbi:hypothetical protein GQF61_17230 [Sphingobacterium sp. DK4209]|uniref:Peptidase M56 domain-containing protein n=1 Tax=Sphingobacterium zhuxiongii TaxID=2662364 RepID=A0A5Q0QCR0_9SPHI|nr:MULTISPECIES: M56 family metallopeptidase [unclassified Sphingobacterium]MVZ67592.1 hypothetical protein [Sphingobacterium sp. DK4209]QGA25478.1 hypothetical protein GFH32_03700 [Sphingobacterium sp. dk4302]
MESILTYLLQVNLLIVLIYLGYYFLLKGLTFYNLNRIYFIVGTLYAFIYPFLDIKSWFSRQVELPIGEVLQYFPIVFQEKASFFSLSDLLIMLASAGAIALFAKLLIQLFSLFRIHLHSEPSAWRQYIYRNVIFPIAPFSFFNKIYVHKDQHMENELYDIFKHEHVHVEGHHTWDVLLFEIVLVSCWYNPFVWLMRKAVRQNLEYLTDQQVLDKGVDRQTYQYSLLNVSKQGASVAISNQFNFKTLKKRIMMMNKKRSSKLELSKYAFLLPVFILAGATFTLQKAEAKIETVVIKAAETNVSAIGTKLSGNIIQQDTTKIKYVEQDVNTSNEDVVVQGFPTDSLKGKVTGVRVVTGYKSNIPDQLSNEEAAKHNIIVVDGKVMPKDFDISLIDNSRIDDVRVLTGNDAKAYGAKAKETVLSVKTRKKGDAATRTWYVQDNKGITFTGNSVAVRGYAADNQHVEYEIDGKIVSKAVFEQLKPEDIHSVNVLKGEGKSDDGKQHVGSGTVKVYTKAYAKEHNIENPNSVPNLFEGTATDGKGKTSTFKAEQSGNKKTSEQLILNNGQTKNIAYVKNGELVNSNVLKELSPDKIASVEVLKGENAKSKYGDKYDGVIIITTKDSPLADNIQHKEHDVIISAKKEGTLPKDVLYFIDEKEVTWEQVSKLKPEEIKSMNVFKAGKATEKFGERGKNGVIKIETKSAEK